MQTPGLVLGAGAASGRAVVVRRIKGERAGAKAPSFGFPLSKLARRFIFKSSSLLIPKFCVSSPSSCEESGPAESWARAQVLTSSSKARFELIEPRAERT